MVEEADCLIARTQRVLKVPKPIPNPGNLMCPPPLTMAGRKSLCEAQEGSDRRAQLCPLARLINWLPEPSGNDGG